MSVLDEALDGRAARSARRANDEDVCGTFFFGVFSIVVVMWMSFREIPFGTPPT